MLPFARLIQESLCAGLENDAAGLDLARFMVARTSCPESRRKLRLIMGGPAGTTFYGEAMLVGHLAVGLIGKRIEPRVSLSTWMVAVLLADLLIFPFLMAGIEHVDAVPGVTANRIIGRDIGYSHSLLMDLIWATLFAAAYFLRRRYPRGAWLLFAAVLSHWLLDFVSHRPDMPLFPGGQGFGLGLWNSLAASLIVEGGLWVLAIILYVRGTVPVKRAGVYVFWTVIVLLTLVWKGNITAGMDPNPIRAGVGGLVGITLIVAWAYWIDRLRYPKSFPVTANAAEIEARP